MLVALALPLVAWRVRHGSRSRNSVQESIRDFGEWAASEFDIAQSHVGGAAAAVEILLPIAAVACGITAFAIIALLAG